MAASLMNMLDDLETRLERTQAELQALREENQRLKQQLAQQDVQAQSVPSSNPTTTIESETHSEAARDTAPATAETAKTPSPHALLNQWYERYPNAFFKGHTKPLKVGIHQELAEREKWPNKLIRRALANYVNLPRYIKAVREGVERVDLDGQPAGKVDKEAALHASVKRGEKKEGGQPKKAQSKPSPAAKNTRQKNPKQPDLASGTEPGVEPGVEKIEPRKPLSMEDKLLDLQQKFKGR